MKDEVVEVCDPVGHVEGEGVPGLVGRGLDVVEPVLVDDALREPGHVVLHAVWGRLLIN